MRRSFVPQAFFLVALLVAGALCTVVFLHSPADRQVLSLNDAIKKLSEDPHLSPQEFASHVSRDVEARARVR